MNIGRTAATFAFSCALSASCGGGEGVEGIDLGRAALELRSVDDPVSACGGGRRIAASQALARDVGDDMGSDTGADLGADTQPTPLGAASTTFDEDDKRFAFDIVLDLSGIRADIAPGDVVRAAISVSPGSALAGAGAPAPGALALTGRPAIEEAGGVGEAVGGAAIPVPKFCQRAFVAYNSPGSFELSVRSFDAVAYLSVSVAPEDAEEPQVPARVKWSDALGETFSLPEEVEVEVIVEDSDGNAIEDVTVSWAATLPGVLKDASTTTNEDGVAKNTFIVPANLPNDPNDPFALRPVVLTATAGAAAARAVLSPE